MESVSQACQPLWYFFLGIYPPISQSKVSPTTGKVFPCKTTCSVVFDDFDEFKVPVQTENMPSLLYSIHDSNYCGHCFTSAKFSTLVSLTQNYFLFTQNVLHRSPQAESLHTKVNALIIRKECFSMQYILSCNNSKATKLTIWIGTKPEFSIAENVNHHVTWPLIWK